MDRPESDNKKQPIDEVKPLIEHKEDVFYYKLEDNDKIYKIKMCNLKLIPFFYKLPKRNKKECSIISNPIILPKRLIHDKSYDKDKHYINIIEHHDFLEKYLQIWDNNIKKEAYIKCKTVQSGDPEHYIEPQDLQIIVLWIKMKLNQLPDNIKIKIKDSEVMQKQYQIKCLNPLLNTLSGYLEMEGLKNKILVYISTLLYNCSLEELSESINNEEFKEMFRDMQSVAIEEWEHENQNRLNMVAKSETTLDIRDISD